MGRRKKLILNICKIFKIHNIEYLILSNIESNSIKGDVDILIQKKFKLIRRGILKEFKEASIKVLMEKKGLAKNTTLSIYSSHFNQTLRIDFYEDIVLTSNKTYPKIYFLNSQNFFVNKDLDKEGFFKPSKENLFIYLLFRKLLKKDYSIKTKNHLKSIVEEIKSINPKFKMDILFNQWLNNFNSDSRLELVSYLEKNDMSSKINIFYLFKNRIYNLLLKKINAPHIAFIGPDGCGKSTLISQIENDFNYLYGKSKYIHLRPTLIPASRNIKKALTNKEIGDIPNPHAYKPYNYMLSFIKFFFIFIDYLLGYSTIKLKTLNGQPVISDRYFYDVLVDPKRFRFSKINLFQSFLIKIFLPRPDITFLLTAPADIIFSRKQDLQLMEIDRQNKAYISLTNKFSEIQIIDASISINDVYNVVRQKLFYKYS